MIMISKHLMLLFIRSMCRDNVTLTEISKHLMLLFISDYDSALCIGFSISKHLMLLFIASCVIIFTPVCNFKTSHVIVYRVRNPNDQTISVISKHLMLLFIPRISAFFSFSPPLFPLIFSIFLHFLPANTLILDRPTYHPINLLIFQAFLDFSFFFRLVKIL